MRRLYDSKESGNSYKVRLLLAQLELPYELRPVNILEGESRTPSFKRDVHVAGRVPVLEEDGRVIAESNAILVHLARGTEYLPDDLAAQDRILEWLFFEQNQLEVALGGARYYRRFAPEHPRAAAASQLHAGRGRAALERLEAGLQEADFLVHRYSIADIALFAYTHLAEEGGFSLQAYPAIRAWISRVSATPRFEPMGAAAP